MFLFGFLSITVLFCLVLLLFNYVFISLFLLIAYTSIIIILFLCSGLLTMHSLSFKYISTRLHATWLINYSLPLYKHYMAIYWFSYLTTSLSGTQCNTCSSIFSSVHALYWNSLKTWTYTRITKLYYYTNYSFSLPSQSMKYKLKMEKLLRCNVMFTVLFLFDSFSYLNCSSILYYSLAINFFTTKINMLSAILYSTSLFLLIIYSFIIMLCSINILFFEW